ncbi:MAG TPA: heparan-alpha-glucosaminide N-acetyltransferase domain-containing protein, partial [Vitreimonas sp.]|nr:heparan-alpha-glucosaminide N-acetyltransferase domain-containing protein [Vitreimonas sp.]
MTDAALSPAQPARAPSSANLAAGVRITEIDMLRGLVIVLMALDHCRDYFHAGAFTFNPLDPTQTTASTYVTRWITHLCAPTFVLLAGVSAYLQFAKGKSTP